jgi:ABC-type transporter MlaC component
MKKYIFSSSIVFILVVSVIAQPGTGKVDTPLQLIKQSNQQVLEIFKNNPKVTKDVEDQIFSVIDGVTDFSALSKSVIDQFCPKLTESQCQEFDRVFQRLLRISSIKKLGRYRADRFDYQGEEIEGTKAVVKTIAHYKDDRVQLNYHLINQGQVWKVINYVVDDVDTVRNYKKQFVRLFARSTFRKIIERLQKKIRSYQQESQN